MLRQFWQELQFPARIVGSYRPAIATRVRQGVVYGKPVNQGITQLKPTRNLKNIAEERVGRKIGSLRVLNSYWVNQVGLTKFAEFRAEKLNLAISRHTFCFAPFA